ncbi:MAG TPA: outer membrane beta-barrel protein [Pyrinomonadaceae bacterium]|nr:outer membrane beta-barrel protein [Pyrinomonadaceae bacterium]
MIVSKPLGQCLLALGILLVACVTPLFAQQGQKSGAPRVEGKVIFGTVTFGEDIDHTTVGAALRTYVTKRFSIETEYLYLRNGENDQDHLVQPSVAYDFADPAGRLVPYVIGGAGVLHHKGAFFGASNSFTTWTASAGVGAKIFVTKNLFVSPELRLGREPTIRATINVGYVFGRRG